MFGEPGFKSADGVVESRKLIRYLKVTFDNNLSNSANQYQIADGASHGHERQNQDQVDPMHCH